VTWAEYRRWLRLADVGNPRLDPKSGARAENPGVETTV
jgi:hypothetical protein